MSPYMVMCFVYNSVVCLFVCFAVIWQTSIGLVELWIPLLFMIRSWDYLLSMVLKCSCFIHKRVMIVCLVDKIFWLKSGFCCLYACMLLFIYFSLLPKCHNYSPQSFNINTHTSHVCQDFHVVCGASCAAAAPYLNILCFVFCHSLGVVPASCVGGIHL